MKKRIGKWKRAAAFLLVIALMTAYLPLKGDMVGSVAAAQDASGDSSNSSGDASGASGNATGTSSTPVASTETPASSTAADTTPAPVTKLSVSNQTMTSITVGWDAVAGVDGYILQTYNYTTKVWDAVDTIVADKNLASYTYVVNDMNAGTTHRFRMCTYVGTIANTSPVVKSIKTGCKPAVLSVTGVKGDKCARLTWNAVNAAGYYIYQKMGTGAYEKIATITDAKQTSYLVTGLTNGYNYSFVMKAFSTFAATDDGVSYSNTLEGDNSLEVVITPSTATKTSSSAALYSKVATFKTSPAYKTYALAKKINTSKCFITPGVATTNVNGINSENFVTAGSVCAKTYYFLSAYDATGVENSVIYVMKRSTHKYVMTLVLPNKEKVTDMTFDGNNIWMTAGSQIACVRYKTITSKISTGLDSTSLAYMNTYTTISNPTYMAYYDGVLWVGSYSTSKNYMSGYRISSQTSTKPVLTYYKRMQMLAKVRAIEIDSSGYLYTIRAAQVKKGQSGYVSQMRSYLPTWNTTSATIKKNSYKKLCKLPAMSCGISFYNTYAYINFDSVKEEECRYPTDRSWAVKLTNLR